MMKVNTNNLLTQIAIAAGCMVVTLAVSACSGAQSPTTTITTMPTLAGEWSGVGNQVSPATTWPIEITFNPDAAPSMADVAPGTPIGRSVYPEQGCNGTLLFARVEGTTLYADERIELGRGDCVDEGSFAFELLGDSIAMSWSYADGVVGATGDLYHAAE